MKITKTCLAVYATILAFIFLITLLIILLCPGEERSILAAGHSHWGLFYWFVKVMICSIPLPIIIDYFTENPRKAVKMNFTAFRDTYHLNPEAWILSYTTPSYHQPANASRSNIRYVVTPEARWMGSDIYDVRFSFVDWIKFKWWSICNAFNEAHQGRVKKAEKDTEALVAILESMQRDVNKAYKAAEEFCKNNKIS